MIFDSTDESRFYDVAFHASFENAVKKRHKNPVQTASTEAIAALVQRRKMFTKPKVETPSAVGKVIRRTGILYDFYFNRPDGQHMGSCVVLGQDVEDATAKLKAIYGPVRVTGIYAKERGYGGSEPSSTNIIL